MTRPGPKKIVEDFLANELSNREMGVLESYTKEARRAVAAFKRLIIQEPQTTKQDERYRQAAKAQFQEEGEIEIDDNATISYGDESGAYVGAWVWVNKTTLPKPEKKFPSGD